MGLKRTDEFRKDAVPYCTNQLANAQAGSGRSWCRNVLPVSFHYCFAVIRCGTSFPASKSSLPMGLKVLDFMGLHVWGNRVSKVHNGFI